MTRFVGAVLAGVVAVAVSVPARAADDKDVTAILDKAIKALGGEEKLATVKAATWKTKGKINIAGTEADVSSQTTIQTPDKVRAEFEGEFGGMKLKGLTVLNGDKGWRQLNDMTSELDNDGIAEQKRGIYLQMVPTTVLPLKGKDFKVETAGEEKIDGKPAVGLKVVGPEGKDFKIYFDKESGLPVRVVAKVKGFTGEDVTQETNLSAYKDFDGVKKATKIQAKRDGENFLEVEVIEFKVLKDVDPKTFAEPK